VTAAPGVTQTQPAIVTLLRRAIDYAGLFPPASLDMHSAVSEYQAQANGPDAWALGRFVLPAARLEELDEVAGELTPREARFSWGLSALLGSDLSEDVERIEQFNARHRDVRDGAVYVDTVELKTHTVHEIAHAAELLDRRFDTYMEVPIKDDPGELLDSIARTRAKAKVRTGGVASDAFPPATQLLRFITRCIERRVSFKATAGMHHPLRGDYRLTYAPDAARGTMFGFLNVLLATAALSAGMAPDACAALLEEGDPGTIRPAGDGLAWRDHVFSAASLDAGRDSMTAFGSCSFREPLADLRASHLL